jgi:hypothetical protein
MGPADTMMLETKLDDAEAQYHIAVDISADAHRLVRLGFQACRNPNNFFQAVCPRSGDVRRSTLMV